MPERLRPLRPAELDDVQRALYRRITTGPRAGQPFRSVTSCGELLGPFNALLYAPELGAAVQHVGERLRFSGALPARIRELVILAVGTASSSAYELYAHTRIARAIGITDAEIAAITSGQLPESCDEPERLALRLGERLPLRVSDQLYAQARVHFDEAELVELAVLVGYYRLLAGVLGTFDVSAPEDG